jgi:hypothetical protein
MGARNNTYLIIQGGLISRAKLSQAKWYCDMYDGSNLSRDAFML